MDEDDRPRIADFGLAQAVDSRSSSAMASSRRGKGSMRFQAPELLNPSRFEGFSGDVTRNSDVYAYACVCLEVSGR